MCEDGYIYTYYTKYCTPLSAYYMYSMLPIIGISGINHTPDNTIIEVIIENSQNGKILYRIQYQLPELTSRDTSNMQAVTFH